MRIVLVTDAWHPQINGVVHTWTYMRKALTDWGHELIVVSPEGSRTMPAPSEPDVRLCIEPRRHLLRVLADRMPDTLHIATEGPLGLAARKLARQRGWRFTTSFHTMFPDYLQARMGIPVGLTWCFMRWFHRPSQQGAGAHAHGARYAGAARPAEPAGLGARRGRGAFRARRPRRAAICRGRFS